MSAPILTVVETSAFLRRAEKILSEEEHEQLLFYLASHPTDGDEIQGTGGVRKLRFAPPSRHGGKSGAMRVCYVAFVDAVCYLLIVFPKNEAANLSAKDKVTLKQTVNALRRTHSKK